MKMGYKPKIEHRVIDGIEYKFCRECKLWLELSVFSLKTDRWDGLSGKCKSCQNKYAEEYRGKNKEEINRKLRNYYYENKEKRLAKDKRRYESKKKEIIDQHKDYLKRRKLSDVEFKLRCNIRRRIHLVLDGINKSENTLSLLGCSVEYFKSYLESKFTDGMNWENYGSYWQIDHIIPCSAFDLTQEVNQKICFHYKNMQPLSTTENKRKSDFLPNGIRARDL